MSKIKYIRTSVALAAVLLMLFTGLFFGSRYGSRIVTKTETVVDTFYVGSSPIEIPGEPIVRELKEPETIYVPFMIPGESDTIYKTDTIYRMDYKLDESTATATDTARNDRQWVAVSDSFNCSKIVARKYVWGGEQKVIQKTITNTKIAPPDLISLWGGVATSYNSANLDVRPSLMVLWKERFGVEYGHDLRQGRHNIGLKLKIK